MKKINKKIIKKNEIKKLKYFFFINNELIKELRNTHQHQK